MHKLVITCAVTGAETTRQDTPNLPVTPEEIARSAHEACLAGASILHLHVRDDKGEATQDPDIFKNTIDLVRSKCDMAIEVTTGGAVGMSLEERLQPLHLSPEMASLDCGTVNFGDDYIVNTLPMIREAASMMNRFRVRPTLECFDLSHVDTSLTLIEEGLLVPPFHYGFVLNIPGGVRYDTDTLKTFARRIPANSYFTVIAVGGKAHMQSISDTIALKGFLRAGFEDNIYFEKGVLAQSNAQLVERIAFIAKKAGHEIATPGDVRKMLKLKGE